MELLAPAGNRKALDAAVAAGADAIYLGYTAFSARSYAGNFDEKGLRDAIRYAHQYGRRIYVTVNTLVKEPELEELKSALGIIRDAGADAILIQDMGVFRMARQLYPDLVLHASTQMTVNNVQGTALLRKMGIARVVPARECRLSELRAMADTGTEIEAFVHGALCVCVSGQCLFSGMIGGRSGNRGKCSQPCRLPYTLADGTHGYLLSPKDLMLIGRIRELQDAGIASLKIEGRMKSPEYVATVTDAYRRAIDHPEIRPDDEMITSLRQAFNRGGFTEGYILSRNHAALMSWQKPNHWGIPVGKLTGISGRTAAAKADTDIETGDLLQIRHEDVEQDIAYTGPAVRAGKTLSLSSDRALTDFRPGDTIWRLTSARQQQRAHEFVPKERERIKITAVLEAIPGQIPRLTLTTEDGRTGEAVGTRPTDAAGTAALTEASVAKPLGKLRETPYELAAVHLIGQQAYLPMGELNALRRAAVADLETPPTAAEVPILETALPDQTVTLTAVTETLSEVPDLLAAGADQVAWLPRDYRIASLEAALASCSTPVVFVLPTVTETEELRSIAGFVRANSSHFLAVQVNNIGQIGETWPVPVYGGQGLNVMNSECARMYTQLGLTRLTASCELNAKEIRALRSAGGNYEVECYGRVQLMMLTHCPRRTKAGDTSTDSLCNRCEPDGGWCETLTDRKGMQFKLRRIKMHDRCQISLYNSVVTDMAKRPSVLSSLGCAWRLMFTDESPEERCRIVRSYRRMMDGGMPDHEPAQSSTCGQLLRGVE